MSITFYPAKFKMREDGSYEPLAAIRGEPGADGATGPAGRGVGEGTFAPIVLIQSAQPTEVVDNTMWVEYADETAVGSVMVGTDTTLPTTKPDGSALAVGDIYVMNRGTNLHPLVWGNVALFPLRVWMYYGNAWNVCTAHIYVNSQWYDLGAEWIVEGGELVGILLTNTYTTVTEAENTLILEVSGSTGSNMWCYTAIGAERTFNEYPGYLVMDGEITSSIGGMRFGAYTPRGPQITTTAPNGSGVSSSSGTMYNPKTDNLTSVNSPTIAVQANNVSHAFIRIKNLYRVYTGAIPVAI